MTRAKKKQKQMDAKKIEQFSFLLCDANNGTASLPFSFRNKRIEIASFEL